jgi:hypothetical protein
MRSHRGVRIFEWVSPPFGVLAGAGGVATARPEMDGDRPARLGPLKKNVTIFTLFKYNYIAVLTEAA